MSTVRMYELIKKTNLSDEEAEALVVEIEALTSQRFDDRKELLATKIDLAQAETRLGDKINNAYRGLILWVIGTGVGSVLLKSLVEYMMQ